MRKIKAFVAALALLVTIGVEAPAVALEREGGMAAPTVQTTNRTSSGTGDALSITTSSLTAGWWVIAAIGWDIETMADMPDAPGGTYTDGWQLIAKVDAGDDLPKWKVYAHIVETTAAITVTTPDAGLGLDPDAHLHVMSVSGAPAQFRRAFRSRVSYSDAATTTQTADQLYAAGTTDRLIGFWLAGGGTTNYTLPGSMTIQTEVDSGSSTSRTGHEALAAYGPTGVRTATTSSARVFAAVLVSVQDGSGSVTFPGSALGIRIEAAIGADLTGHPDDWTWTAITTDALYRHACGIARGRADEASRGEYSRCNYALNNASGDYSTKNTTGAHYGQLRINTPTRVWVSPGDGWSDRFSGYIPAFNPRWTRGLDRWVPVGARGPLYLVGNHRDSRSALKSSILASGPAAYWPMEDKVRSTRIASGLPGGPPLLVDPDVAFADEEGPPGSDRLIDMAPISEIGKGATFGGFSGQLGSGTDFEVSIVAKQGGLVGSDDLVVNFGTGTGANQKWTLNIGSVQVILFNEAGTLTVNYVTGDMDNREWHHIRVRVTQSGGNRTATLWVDNVQRDTDTQADTGGNGFTSFDILTPAISPSATDPVASVGHLAGWAPLAAADVPYEAVSGYVGETQTERLERVCAEYGILSTVVQANDQSRFNTTMGTQVIGTLLDVLREVETTDAGILYEEGFGVGYLTRGARYSPPVSLALDYGAYELWGGPEPNDDDQRLVNDVLVEQRDGSSARASDDEGTVATLGRRSRLVTVKYQHESVLHDRAPFELALGTMRDLRWPLLSLHLGRPEFADLIGDWLGLPLQGGRLTLDNPPEADVGPEDVDLIVEGWTEQFTSQEWSAALSSSPGTFWQPWQIEGGGNRGRLQTAGSTLASSATDSATSLSVASTGKLWTTSGVDFDVEILDVGATEGERVTVTAISGASSPQTFTATRSVNGAVMAHDAGATVRLWRPSGLAL